MLKVNFVIPTINRADLLINLLQRLQDQLNDERVNELLIIDNGHQDIISLNKKIRVETMPHNLGVAASWNFGISWSFDNPDITHLVALNDDIILGMDQVGKILEVIGENPDKWMMVGPYYWSVWCISREGAKVMEYTPRKYFDENFYPAYFEDNDFYRRMILIDQSKYLPNISAFAPESGINSGSLAKDHSLNFGFESNKKYYISKWGGEPNKERFTEPFNIRK